MSYFSTNIIKRLRISKLAVTLGLLSVIAIVWLGRTYWALGHIPALDRLAAQLGIIMPIERVYLVSFVLLIFLLIPAFRTIFKKKKIIGGRFNFDEENLYIVDGKTNYTISLNALTHLQFELVMPVEDSPLPLQSSYLKIPSEKGRYTCEFELANHEDYTTLLKAIELLKTVHHIEISVTNATSPS